MSKRIIIVDAEVIVRDVVAGILKKAGYEVTPTDSPDAVLAMIKDSPPALVITNVSLPGISGHDAMLMFKKSCPDVPVLMISGLPDVSVIREWEQQDGFSAFPKPFTARELKDKVQAMVGAATA